MAADLLEGRGGVCGAPLLAPARERRSAEARRKRENTNAYQSPDSDEASLLSSFFRPERDIASRHRHSALVCIRARDRTGPLLNCRHVRRDQPGADGGRCVFGTAAAFRSFLCLLPPCLPCPALSPPHTSPHRHHLGHHQ
jgi:hypothetical protein